ncbi:bromodomain-containing protein 3 [Tripterygium wilfordii]|uniref:Bromodomain-containing protein 3 n=1 Tax=Tripterygium wilfordii TaxID=458696 RepID=A0A7J7CCI4_TRIWF|nr:bromodomain-containing factor 2 [Tripterygium wilfordii]KAF5731812.1 bromodomain-containing protein 3 [Tripterygium wilfordii]
MKRKRGHKKGKPKAPPVVAAKEAVSNVISVNSEDNSNADEFDNDENESRMQNEINTPSSTGTDQPVNLASINPDGSIDKAAGKFKLKLKTSKMLESQSDTDKSSGGQLGMEKRGMVTERVEDSANSLRQTKMGVSGSMSKKAGSIKIKSCKVFGGSSSVDSGTSNAAVVQTEGSQKNNLKASQQNSRYNKQELESALMVIKKVMKMDAAEPFNVPVNPEALGIPDYFDVIDTPMDFGTICSNIERCNKYMNSEDVFKDVQYIWENCYRYNNKGDYIVDLMKRVKKNFMKYWTGAGLYTEQPRGTNGVDGTQAGVDGTQADDNTSLSQGRVQARSSQLKQKSQKRHGRRHKHDCLCAICVLKRRKREREENSRISKALIGAEEFRQEETSLVESPRGEDSSSNVEESLDLDVDADVDADVDNEVEGKRGEMKVEVAEPQYSPKDEKQESREEEEDEEEEENNMEIERKEGESPVEPQLGDRSKEDGQSRTDEKSGMAVQANTQKGDLSMQDEEENAISDRKNKKLQEKEQRAKMYEHFLLENPMLPSLCGFLFPSNRKSLWSGPHSLVPHQVTGHSSSLHAAVETLMK